MKKYICLLAGAALLAGCEQKETTVTNPPAEKKEGSTYEKKKDGTYDYTVINTPPAETTTKEETEVNVNTSPTPSP
jgi:PBP1b-binding outer membrane lipoprotein LpoB